MTLAQKAGTRSRSPSFTPSTEKSLQSERNEDSAPQHLEAARAAQTVAGQPNSDPIGSVRVTLTNGLTALVDAEDAPHVLAHRWHPTHHKARPDRAYAQRTWNKDCVHHTQSLHRFVLGARPGQVVDHINGNRLDCRRSNLRLVTHRDNIRNIRLSKNQRAGGYKGVRQARGKSWTATIRVGPLEASGSSRRVHLGTFKSPELAAHAYDRAALAAFGEFAATNFELVDGEYRISAATLAAREQAAFALGLMAGGTRA